MKKAILSLPMIGERDVVSARRRARQIAELLGFDAQDQTRIATAVSEIARNAVCYAGGGTVEFLAGPSSGLSSFIIRISDRGPGIPELPQILEGSYVSATGMGLGITGARRIMDDFSIESSGAGTTVVLAKQFPRKASALTAQRLARVAEQLTQQDEEGDLLSENQQQSRELLRVMDELLRTNSELDDTNRGVLALYAELEDKAERLRTAGEMKSCFLSHMGHEFRTPLNSILALARLLLDSADGPLTPEQEKQVSFIRKSAENLYDLVNDLLDLAKVEAGKINVNAARFQVSEFFGALRGMLKPLLQNDAVELIFEDPSGIPALHTDEGKLSQILRNLISNALKFTERGHVRVSAALSPEGRAVVFSVEDTGIGIASSDLERIFHEFAQVENQLQTRVRGTGLGLPLSRKLAELLGGEITVTSRPGLGSTFCVRIPVVLEEVRDPAGPARILIVDDEDVARYLLRQTLAGTHCVIAEAANGPEAIVHARQNRPSAIFLDLRMPKMDGFEVLAALKSDARTRDIPVVVVTSKSIDEEETSLLGRDASAMLSKDFLSRGDATMRIRDILSHLGVDLLPALSGTSAGFPSRDHKEA
jgi:signal transduction histidine kinase